jgi:hypothetical protein
MDPLSYLTTFSTTFGALEIIFLIAHAALLLAGAYYGLIARDSDPVRGASLRSLGFGLLALGAVGTLLGVLRLAVGAVFSMPLWFAIVTLLDLVLIAYALYYALSVYPARRAALAQASRGRGIVRGGGRPQPTLQSNGASGRSYSAPRPIATTTRRESRRDRKRKGR